MSRYRVEVRNVDRVLLEEHTRVTRRQADAVMEAMISNAPRSGASEIMIVDTFDGDRVVRHWINGTEEDVS